MTDIPPGAVTAAAEPILRRLPSLGPERCRTIAAEALGAAAPHITAVRPESCPLCGCDLGCRGCYCHDDPDGKSYKAGAAAERERILTGAEELKSILHRPGLGTGLAHNCCVEVIGMGKLRHLISGPQPVGADAEPGDLYGPPEET